MNFAFWWSADGGETHRTESEQRELSETNNERTTRKVAFWSRGARLKLGRWNSASFCQLLRAGLVVAVPLVHSEDCGDSAPFTPFSRCAVALVASAGARGACSAVRTWGQTATRKARQARTRRTAKASLEVRSAVMSGGGLCRLLGCGSLSRGRGALLWPAGRPCSAPTVGARIVRGLMLSASARSRATP